MTSPAPSDPQPVNTDPASVHDHVQTRGSTLIISKDCLQETFRHSMPPLVVDGQRSGLDGSGHPSCSPYGILTVEDVVPIETARARFLDIFVDNFIKDHVIEVGIPEKDEYGFSHDKFSKRKQKDVQYEGDPRFVLPLMYVANLYESLVSEVNIRLSSLDGIREKTIGISLEAAGGLYRKLARKFPRKGSCSFKRRELATSVETRTKFPELVVEEEKRVRFVVVNGLEILEMPNNIPPEDAEWLKRLTGRHEVVISSRDYKFYLPRHKYRRVSSVSPNPSCPAYTCCDGSSPIAANSGFCLANQQSHPKEPPSKHRLQPLPLQNEFQSLHQSQQGILPNQHSTEYSHMHQCQPGSDLAEISHTHQISSISQHVTCIQTVSGDHVGRRLHLLPTGPAKFCDQCGTPYLRETSKFCSECGTRRLGI